MSVRPLALILCGALAASGLGCGDDPPANTSTTKTGKKLPSGKKAAGKQGEAEQAAADQRPPPVGPPIDFNDSALMRDPFMSFAREFAEEAKKRVRSQRNVVLDQYGLDELKLAGLVTGIRPARAMLIDPTKKGHVVHEGQFVGRAEVVQGGASGADYEINWRIDRIRDSDIVLVREDPSNPDVPSATRVIPLRPDEVLAAAQ